MMGHRNAYSDAYLDESPANNRDRWLLSYADLLTLLLAFFVVMYSVSAVNNDKLALISSSLAEAFNEEAFEPEAFEPEAFEQEAIKQQDWTRPDKLIEALALDIEGATFDFDRSSGVEFTLSLPGELLFASGSATLKAGAREELARLLPLLHASTAGLVVEGHTDDEPTQGKTFASNWELSAGRAATAVRFLEASGIERNRLSIVGMADTDPIASNETPAGQASNRRVVFKVQAMDWQRVEQMSPLPSRQKDISETSETLSSPPTLPNLDEIDPVLLEELLRNIEGGGN